MRKTIIILMTMAFILPAATDALAKNRGEKGNFMKQLDLSKEQLASMRALRTEMKKTMISDNAELQLKRLEFQEELQRTTPDRRIIDELIADISQLTAHQTGQRLTMKVKMMEILTPEQKEKMAERMSQGMFGGGHERRGGPGGQRGPGGDRRGGPAVDY